MNILLAALYLMVVMLYTALTKLSVGLPLRTVVLLFLSGLIVFAYPREARDFLRRHVAITGAFAALGVIGIVLTYYSERSIGSTFEGLTSNIVQPYLILFCVLQLIRLIGVWPVAMLTFAGAALTGFVALLQFFDVEIGWRLREMTSDLQHEPSAIQTYVRSRERALGLSLSPIVFSYHMTCTYLALNVLYRFHYLRFFTYYGSVFLVAVATLANGTRSVLLGIVASEMIMELRRGTPRAILQVGLIAAAGAAFYLYAEATGSRVADTEDASALGRIVLFNFGVRLAIDNPLGFGWDFNPAGFAWLYWEHLSDFVNADGVFRLGLHNAYLNFFLMYGLAGVAVAIIALFYDPRYVFMASLYLSAYIVHIVVHNNGMFIGDYFFWFSFGIMMDIFERQGFSFGATAQPYQPTVFAPQRRWT